jgi:hypothetical protein
VGCDELPETFHGKGRVDATSPLLERGSPSWLRKRDESRRFHLGGGVGGASESLFEFKLRFDEGGLVESALGKEIHDEQAYRALGGQGCDGWSPAYRRTA